MSANVLEKGEGNDENDFMRGRHVLIGIVAVAVAGIVIGLLVAKPWNGGSEAQGRLGPAQSFQHPTRPVIGAAGGAAGNLPPSALSAAEVTEALNAHNAWRKRYGIAPLAWDAQLAAYAQEWANKIAASGVLEHRPNNDANPTGENIGMGYPTVTAVTDAWGNEVADYDLKTDTCAAGKVCGHFTQVVWSTTTTVGCGKATGGDSIYWVCNYKPPGNYAGDTFRTGTQAG